MNKILLAFIIVVAAVGLWNLAALVADLSAPQHRSYEFCEDMGYTYDGYYLDYKYKDYGMIECSTCFADGCEEESFNVTKDWRGRLNIYDALVSQEVVGGEE